MTYLSTPSWYGTFDLDSFFLLSNKLNLHAHVSELYLCKIRVFMNIFYLFYIIFIYGKTAMILTHKNYNKIVYIQSYLHFDCVLAIKNVID